MSDVAHLPFQMEENGEERIVNIDGAVSAEHATIEYEAETGRFFIRDGVSKPSTNGTWIRYGTI
jgi:hypothetical protein